jgi:hypothetical protein
VVHSFSPDAFAKVIDEGLRTTAEVGRTAQGKLDEHRFRRKGLTVGAFFLVLLAGLLALKARHLERARAAGAA